MEIITTGIPGLDEMLNGGMPEKLITAVIGPAGSGKTIMSLQFLHTSLVQGKKCIYISIAHSEEELLNNALNYGWDFEPYINNKQLLIKIFQPVSMELKGNEIHLVSSFLDELPEYLYSHKAEIIILDSITEYLMLCKNDIERRSRLLYLFQITKNNKSTTFITAETDVDSTNSKFGIVEFVVDGIITLRRVQSEDLAELVHVIQITKMRWVKHSREIKQYDITDAGIEVYNKYQVMIGG